MLDEEHKAIDGVASALFFLKQLSVFKPKYHYLVFFTYTYLLSNFTFNVLCVEKTIYPTRVYFHLSDLYIKHAQTNVIMD